MNNKLICTGKRNPIRTYLENMKANHHFIQSGIWRDIVFDTTGRKYLKICSILSNGQKCAIQFIDPLTRDVYKAKSWRQKDRRIGHISSEGDLI